MARSPAGIGHDWIDTTFDINNTLINLDYSVLCLQYMNYNAH